ncbi:MAG: hypothetical protein Q9166_000290 [cf. Caloplaca sp. 2 TL-2023]
MASITENTGSLQIVADIMLRRCVLDGRGQGSIASGIGEYAIVPAGHDQSSPDITYEEFCIGRSEQLGLIMRSYHPSVTCRAAFTPWHFTLESFNALVKFFPADKRERIFGPGGEKLPWEIRGHFITNTTKEKTKKWKSMAWIRVSSLRTPTVLTFSIWNPTDMLPKHRALSIVVQTSPFASTYRDTESWWDIYSAVTAIWAMCGEAGRGGIAENIGTFV